MTPRRRLQTTPPAGTATRGLLFAGLAVAFTVLAAPTAGATTTLSRAGNTITLTGDAAADDVSGAGEHSRSQVTFYANDSATRLVAGSGCRFLPGRDSGGHRELSCGAIAKPANPLTLKADLGAGDDRLSLAWGTDRHPRLIADGGEGDDKIYGTQLLDLIQGGPGDDMLYGAQDRDGLKGGPGDDILYGDADSDVLAGEQGRDRLYGDGVDTANNRTGWAAGMDVIDSTDYPADVTGYTAEQILAMGPEADEVFCGPGDLDGAAVDALDIVAASCEGVKGGGRTPITPDTSPLFPATMSVTPREVYNRHTSLRGEPIRFTVNSSAGGFVSANLEVSAADARRFGIPRRQRLIGALTTGVILPRQTTELFLRLTWKVRPALSDERRIPATLTVSATHDNATHTAMETTTASTDIVLR